jgi:hypothetical protein
VTDALPYLGDSFVAGPIQHQPQRTIFIVLHHQHDGLHEIRIAEELRRDQQVPGD